jgi:hypothetical protein
MTPVRRCWAALAAGALLSGHALASLRPPEPEPLMMRVGEQRILLGSLAEQSLSAQPDRLRTVRLPGLGVHVRALATGEAALVWGAPPRLYARVRIEPAPPREDPAQPRPATWDRPALPNVQPASPFRSPSLDESEAWDLSRRRRRR